VRSRSEDVNLPFCKIVHCVLNSLGAEEAHSTRLHRLTRKGLWCESHVFNLHKILLRRLVFYLIILFRVSLSCREVCGTCWVMLNACLGSILCGIRRKELLNHLTAPGFETAFTSCISDVE